MAKNVVYHVHGPVMSSVHVFASRVHHWASVFECSGPVGRAVHLAQTVDLAGVNNEEWVIRVGTGLVGDDRSFYTDANGLLVSCAVSSSTFAISSCTSGIRSKVVLLRRTTFQCRQLFWCRTTRRA